LIRYLIGKSYQLRKYGMMLSKATLKFLCIFQIIHLNNSLQEVTY